MQYIKYEIRKFETADFCPGQQWKEAAQIFASWTIPAIAFVLVVKHFEFSRTVDYYSDAISQGIGPKLWNVISVFGFVFFGLSLVFSKVKIFSQIANQILMNVYAIGALTFGLLLGQFICILPELGQYIDDWRLYLFAPLSAILLIEVAILNLCVWYLSYLIQWQGKFNLRLCQVSILLRLVVGGFIIYLPLWLLWLER
ncbi:MAG: hypothetical protein WAU91_23350 [Desulfatitalea sp.]